MKFSTFFNSLKIQKNISFGLTQTEFFFILFFGTASEPTNQLFAQLYLGV